MTTHTPGPWGYRMEGGDGFVVNPVTGYGIAKVQGQGVTNEANARIIAAAPELLHALHDILIWDDINPTIPSPTAERARRAIAKAEGPIVEECKTHDQGNAL